MAARQIKRYGWHPPLPDFRDVDLAATVNLAAVQVPRKVDLEPQEPPVWNQGDLGSCTGHGCPAVYYVCAKTQGFYPVVPSRLFNYFFARDAEGTTATDAGATVRDAMGSLVKYGAPDETLWPYDIAKFAQRPPAKVITAGAKHQALIYAAVAQTAAQMCQALAAGYPIAIGFSVYTSFESAAVSRTGLVPLPASHEHLLGGHCVMVNGYDLDHPTHVFRFRNSYGAGWGDKGYGRFPSAYLTNTRLAGDFWTIHKTEG